MTVNIFRNIPRHIQVREVCQKWRNIYDEHIKFNLKLDNYYKKDYLSFSHTKVNKLTLKDFNFKLMSVRKLKQICKSIKILKISCKNLTLNNLYDLLLYSKNLKKLYFKDKNDFLKNDLLNKRNLNFLKYDFKINNIEKLTLVSYSFIPNVIKIMHLVGKIKNIIHLKIHIRNVIFFDYSNKLKDEFIILSNITKTLKVYYNNNILLRIVE